MRRGETAAPGEGSQPAVGPALGDESPRAAGTALGDGGPPAGRPASEATPGPPPATPRRIQPSAVIAAWILALGIDFLVHGGILARLYLRPSPFLLPAEEMFRRIPIGYLSFLAVIALVAWLFQRLEVVGGRAGFQYGLAIGGASWGALVVGLYSITTASPLLLLGWWVGQSVQIAAAGGVLGRAAAGVPARRLLAEAVGVAVASFVIVVAAQSLGLAPPMEIR